MRNKPDSRALDIRTKGDRVEGQSKEQSKEKNMGKYL